MKVGDMVIPDFPEHRADWRAGWPDNMTGVVIEVTKWGSLIVMSPYRTEEVTIEYLVALV